MLTARYKRINRTRSKSGVHPRIWSNSGIRPLAGSFVWFSEHSGSGSEGWINSFSTL